MLDARLGWSGHASVLEKSPRVMVVDDDPGMRRALRQLLTQLGYQARMMSSIDEADSWLSLADVDVVLLDITLPGMNGIEFLEWAKRHPKLQMILVTPADDQGLAVQRLKAGARTYLVKPVQPDVLRLAIHDAVAVGRLLAQRNAGVGSTEWSSEVSATDERVLNIR